MIGSGLIATFLLGRLESYPPLLKPVWEKQNAIVILGGGTVKVANTNLILPTSLSYSRLYEGARLYFSCKKSANKCTLIVSGGDALATGKTEADVYKQELQKLNIDVADIIAESKSMNTFKNAQYTSVILKNGEYDHTFLVTSGMHLKRAMSLFSYFGINAIPAPSDYTSKKISFLPKGYHFAVTDLVLHETLGMEKLPIYNFFGWNRQVSR
jgi:uncharacterized SAM-binding protein YcdF (DUF218 family)